MSNFYGLFVVSTMMFDGRDEEEILGLMRSSLPSFAPCRLEAVYLRSGDELTPRLPEGGTEPDLDAGVGALGPTGGALKAGDDGWLWAFPMNSKKVIEGYLVVRGDREPSPEDRFLLQVLSQQTAAALASVSLHERERENVLALSRFNEELTESVRRLERQRAVHEVLNRISVSGAGVTGIAHAVHELTNLPVAIEDPFGHLMVWTGEGELPKPGERRYSRLKERAVVHGRPLHEDGWVLSVVRPRTEVLGMLMLVDPGQVAGEHELFVVEYATTVLALELAHRRSLAEVELRVRRDLMDDLIAGTDDESAYARAAVVGHDLHGRHHVVIVRWRHRRGVEAIAHAAERVLGGWQRQILKSRHAGALVLLVDGEVDGPALYEGMATLLGSRTGAIGVGGRCAAPADIPRSHAEALQALNIRLESASPDGATTFDQLGVYRILSTAENREEVESFVREWLGKLLDYDRKRGSELVLTLFQYLECGGNYDQAAAALMIHRSTLRYRLARIRSIAALDLADVDTRLNLHVAARAWQVLRGKDTEIGEP
ncbi:helix-turn-helix domain-containing protein [Amycolatopsis acidiphila]|nr:helix-turn-helix domain-containing protein [Amycolatopsis acidiphila]UIJ57565.1 helix-turn-helix domain-containing protein [Amycolatopsis acidiphila]